MSYKDEDRSLGDSGLRVSPVAMGCWPIAGMTSLDVNDADSLATLQAALDHGVNFFDTAYCYGREGESERLIGRGLGHRRDEIVIATKGGLHYDPQGKRLLDARPERLRRECEESLRRLGTDRVDLLYLHAPDPATPLAESAGALRDLMAAGKTRCVGVSNVTLEQLETFHAVCPLAAFQPPYNMLQRQIERDTLPWCRRHGVAVVVYWPLLKGLLAGRLPRNYAFPRGDGRAKYVMFQGDQWQKNQDFVDCLREIAQDLGRTVAQVAINWTIHREGITAALCGAKRPYQIVETAGGMGWRLDDGPLQRIDAALAARGEAAVQPAV
ncbi:MAG: aldo/keto reductase [Candidatus Anammoximicrobium sp.]|nr:aldo/keto reductase [Candidatus Anammoximicrobium sp.]